MAKSIKFKKDGYDYIAVTDKGEYCISKGYDLWYVWFNDKRINVFDILADAKKFCQEHYEGKAQGVELVI